MSLPFHVVARKNPQNAAAAPKFFLEAVSRGSIGIEQLLDAVCEDNTLDRDEARMALNRAFKKAGDFLELGFNVLLGDLGYIDLSIRSNGTATEAEATATTATDIVPHFHFGSSLRERIKRVHLEKATVPTPTPTP